MKHRPSHVEDTCDAASQTTDATIFPVGTTVVLGDGMINQLTNEGLSGKNRNVNVFSHSGATITDIKFELMKILPRKPSHISLHVATNGADSKPSRHMCDDLLCLKLLIKDKLPDCIVSISCPIKRLDNSRACLTLVHLAKHLKELDINIIDNCNISEIHLGKKGLHLNDRGPRQLAANFIAHMKRCLQYVFQDSFQWKDESFFFSTNAKAKASINNIEPSIPALLHADISTCEIKSGLNEWQLSQNVCCDKNETLNPNAANFYPQSIKIGFNYYVIPNSFSKSVPLNPEAKSFFSSHIDQNNNMSDVPALSNLPCMKLISHISSVDNYFSAVNANVNTAYCRIPPMLNIRANSFSVISKNQYARSASYQCGNTCDDSSNV